MLKIQAVSFSRFIFVVCFISQSLQLNASSQQSQSSCWGKCVDRLQQFRSSAQSSLSMDVVDEKAPERAQVSFRYLSLFEDNYEGYPELFALQQSYNTKVQELLQSQEMIEYAHLNLMKTYYSELTLDQSVKASSVALSFIPTAIMARQVPTAVACGLFAGQVGCFSKQCMEFPGQLVHSVQANYRTCQMYYELKTKNEFEDLSLFETQVSDLISIATQLRAKIHRENLSAEDFHPDTYVEIRILFWQMIKAQCHDKRSFLDYADSFSQLIYHMNAERRGLAYQKVD